MNSTPSLPSHPLRAIRRAGVPLAAIETSDPAATIKGCITALNGKAESTPIMRWDLARGLVGLNRLGKDAAAGCGEMLTNPGEALIALGNKAPSGSLCFMLNAHRVIANADIMQAVWNLRDTWKANGSTLVLLCSTMKLPDELTNDVILITEALPTPAEIEKIVRSVAGDAGLSDAQIGDKGRIVDTLLGVSAFGAEQALSLSLIANVESESFAGFDRSELWARKRKMIEQTPGLTVWQGGETFADVAGVANIKSYLTSILTSKRNPVNCIGFIDEIEKLFAGSAGDTSGVSQDQLKVFLTEMQDQNIPGIILIGPPGTGKSAIVKGAGAVAGAEVLSIDTGAMTGSLVGESQAKIRQAMKTFAAVSQGKGLFIATCNAISALPPELRRRFTLGTFFVDLPDKSERESIWAVWLKRYAAKGLAADLARPNDEGWTGAEIKACCDVAWRASISLVQAAKFIVPVSKSAGDKISALRKMASGKFISASHEGVYEFDDTPEEKSTARRFNA